MVRSFEASSLRVRKKKKMKALVGTSNVLFVREHLQQTL
jgi:hypothetical protein